MVLPTVLYLSKVLAKLAMGLDRRPELIAHILRTEGHADREENVEKVTLVEQSANVVREAFIKCLTDRSGTPGVHGKPEGKRVGIYLMANLCLKLLFQVCINWPRRGTRRLILFTVRQTSQRRTDVCQHQRPVSSISPFSGITARHVPLLPRPLPLLQQPLLPSHDRLAIEL